LIVVVPLLAVASFFVHREVSETVAFDRVLREAQSARGAVLRIALNEETGLRGFTSTGDRRFLAPYFIARERAARAFRRFEVALEQAGVTDAVPLVERERALNVRWLSQCAEPLIADPNRSARTLALQIGGKARVDEFRSVDRQLEARLGVVAAEADERSERAVSSILIVNAIALTALILAAIGFAYLQSRAARRAFETRLLYENEKRIADALQEAFEQKSLPSLSGVGLHAAYVPASSEARVGGDWYDAFELPDKRMLFSIGDVAGHGLEAAVVMNRGRQAIVSAALGEDDPAAVLARANRVLMLQDSRMATAICGFLDPRSREIVYATAGHPAPVLARPGAGADFLPHAGLPLGLIEDPVYVAFRARAEPGSLLVLYTDGVLEYERDLAAGQARLLEAVAKAMGSEDPAREIQRHVFKGSAPTDDVAILAISFAHVPGDGELLPVNSSQQGLRKPEGGAGPEMSRGV